MLPDAHIKSRLSISYVRALVADAGYTFKEYDEDFGMDGGICDVEYKPDRRAYRETGFGLDFQLKATVNAIPKEGIFFYDLEVKNYLDLIEKNVGRERILILYILPRDRKRWINVQTDKTIVEKAAYWCSLKGKPEVSNKSKVRIRIPESNLLTAEVIIDLLNKVKGGCSIC